MPLDEAYFTWLYSQVGSVELSNLTKTYWKLLGILHNKEFTWDPHHIEKDGNRAQDGKDLRTQFLRETNTIIPKQNDGWLDMGCSFLELMVALAWQLEFEDPTLDQQGWFWALIDNLGLLEYTDANPPNEQTVNYVLDQVISRDYAPDGAGGLFPLRHAEKDQREVELWMQLNLYLLERL